jgi:dihydroorotate dehydrogenase electron transfer subunit
VKQFQAEILANAAVAESWRELTFSWDEGAGEPAPGQFLTLRVSSFSDPLLRRPFAFSSFARAGEGSPARAGIVYQIRGGATRLLSELAPGSRIDLIAPLGKGFPMPGPGERPVLAGGGIGLGPLLFLAERLSAPERGAAGGLAPVLALGVRSASLLPSIALPPGAILCTDDGSLGFRGTPVNWIAHNLPESAAGGKVRLYGCGPLPMLAALAELAAEKDWPASLSAEQWMACGVGACMGCALPRARNTSVAGLPRAGNTSVAGLPRAKACESAEGGAAPERGYLRACSDGPVFDAADIDWRAAR